MPRYVAGTAGAAVLWSAMPQGAPRAALALLVEIGAVLACAVVLRRRRTPLPAPWSVACAGLALAAAASALDLWTALRGRPAPVVAPMVQAAALGLLLAAGALVLASRFHDRRPEPLIDGLIALLATALLAASSALAALVAVAAASVAVLFAGGPQSALRTPDLPPRLARLAVLGAAVLVPVVVVAQDAGRLDGSVAALGLGVLNLLVVVRIGTLLSERERIRAAYLDSEQRFRALVQHAFDVIAIVDADGEVAYVSPSAGRVLGRAPAACVGAPLPRLVAAEDAAAVQAALDAVRSHPSGVTRIEVRLDQPDGGVRWGDVLLANRLADPDVGGVVVNLRDVTERKLAELELSRLALHDPLTGLPNRVRLLERVSAALEAGTPVAVLFIDLDGFKAVNDRHGHDLGDRLLIAVADRLREALRGEDEATRLGGDEFVVLCSGLAAESHVVAIAARLRSRLCEPFALRGVEVHIGCSIGIAQADRDGLRPEELIEAADRAMYRAKRLRSGITVHRWPDDLTLREGPAGIAAG